MKKSILYFVHVPWSWIKQRPQFLAESLTRYYNVTVVSIDLLGKKEQSKIPGLKIVNIYRLPLERFKLISILSRIFVNIQLFFLKNKFDIIWLTSPSLLDISKSFCKDKFVVYDCMDDMIAFTNDQAIKSRIFKLEQELYKRANLQISSAEYLKNQLFKRYGRKQVQVINNAITSDIIEPSIDDNPEIAGRFNDHYFNITYIGTIAEWFDFDLIDTILTKYPNIRFHLFGPSVVEIPSNDKIYHHGPISHDYVRVAMSNSDALIMPFIVTELIKSVNPVKLYEYIAAGKPCIAPRYGESLPFKEFVFLYEDKLHCLEIISKILSGTSIKPREERLNFLKENTWDNRASVIHYQIDKINGSRKKI